MRDLDPHQFAAMTALQVHEHRLGFQGDGMRDQARAPGTSAQTASNISLSRPPPKNTACGDASPPAPPARVPLVIRRILWATPNDAALLRISWPHDPRAPRSRRPFRRTTPHSTEIEPEPAPISHKRSPARGASADSASARIGRLVIWPSLRKEIIGQTGAARQSLGAIGLQRHR